MEHIAAEFVDACEAAGLTTSDDWEMPADNSAILAVCRAFSSFILMQQMPRVQNSKLYAKPAIWLVYKRVKALQALFDAKQNS